MPEVWRSDRQNVDLIVVEDAAEVGDRFGLDATLLFGGKFSTLCEALLVDIADIGDLDARDLGEVADVGAAAAEPHHPDSQSLARLLLGAERSRSDGHCGGGAEEVATVLHGVA